MAATDLVDDCYFDIDDVDVVIEGLDLDQSSADDQFRGGNRYYSANFSDADIVSHCRHGCDSDGGASPAGGWLLAELMAGGDDDDSCGNRVEEEEDAGSSSPADAEAMSAYVAELERFLLEDDDTPCGKQAGGDQLLVATTEVVPAAGRAGRGRTSGEDDEENGDGGGDSLASRKRARNKIKGTGMLTPWGELEVTMTHLAQILVPAAPWPHSPQALLLSCM